MRAGIKHIIGVVILLVVFLLVLIVLVCSVSNDMDICSTFQPFLDFVDNFIYTG
ncbi:MAG: hypothetical protein JXC85_03105 [Candidatus Aenigmarchaeota archaeon]|nr:hypothetical protein [Candidatus Aenigmarchaeota archaeon]